MDPKHDAAGSAEHDALEALRKEELARAQSAAQAHQASSRPSIPMRIPFGPLVYEDKSDRSQSTVETRLKNLEAELKELISLKQDETSHPPNRTGPEVSSNRALPEWPGASTSMRIPNIPIRNKRFSDVLAVSSYRLADTNERLPFDQSMSLTQVANQIRPRMEGYFFSGETPLKVLPFLRHLTRIANQSRLSEATLLWIMEDFLQSPAREAFRAQAHQTWPEAVHWLLLTFASESSLEQAVRSLNLANQAQVENAKQFGLRLQLESSTLGSLISLSETKSLFSQGLNEPVRSLFAAHQPPHELDDTTPLSVLVSRAELLETGTSQRSPSPKAVTRSNPRLPMLVAQNIDEDPIVITETEEIQAIALQANSSSKGLVCFVCYLAGHWWLDCPCLAHLPAEHKEDIAVRRRQYYMEINSRRKNNLSGSERKAESTWMSRPGWKTDQGIRPPASIWPATVVEKPQASSSEKVMAAPKEI
jgi:hypothetical protein